MGINKNSFSNQPQPETYIVQASEVTSSEMYRYPDGGEEPVLRGITMDIKRGECWGIIGDEAFENGSADADYRQCSPPTAAAGVHW